MNNSYGRMGDVFVCKDFPGSLFMLVNIDLGWSTVKYALFNLYRPTYHWGEVKPKDEACFTKDEFKELIRGSSTAVEDWVNIGPFYELFGSYYYDFKKGERRVYEKSSGNLQS